MKNFIVTVNGNTYEVSVEEVSGARRTQGVTPNGNVRPDVTAPMPTPQPQPAWQAPTPPSAPIAPAEHVAPKIATPAPPVTGASKVAAPMPGVILDIPVAVGDAVTANQPVAILEAMKMENEIVTPVAGIVAGIHVNKGDTVNAGTLLISISKQ